MSIEIMNNIKMWYFYRIDVSGGIGVNKTSKSKECYISHYWKILIKGFKFQSHVCNRCHDLLMMFMKISNIAILTIKNTDYQCIINAINKNEAIKSLQNIDLTENYGILYYIKNRFDIINLLEILI